MRARFVLDDLLAELRRQHEARVLGLVLRSRPDQRTVAAPTQGRLRIGRDRAQVVDEHHQRVFLLRIAVLGLVQIVLQRDAARRIGERERLKLRRDLGVEFVERRIIVFAVPGNVFRIAEPDREAEQRDGSDGDGSDVTFHRHSPSHEKICRARGLNAVTRRFPSFPRWVGRCTPDDGSIPPPIGELRTHGPRRPGLRR
jgi:hypothetical protein